jgi:hypothetical protein
LFNLVARLSYRKKKMLKIILFILKKILVGRELQTFSGDGTIKYFKIDNVV